MVEGEVVTHIQEDEVADIPGSNPLSSTTILGTKEPSEENLRGFRSPNGIRVEWKRLFDTSRPRIHAINGYFIGFGLPNRGRVTSKNNM